MEILISIHFIISYMVLPPLFFHGKVFGRLRHPGVSLSLFGQSHGIGFSREITCGLGALISLTGASCVVVMGDSGSFVVTLWKDLLVVELCL